MSLVLVALTAIISILLLITYVLFKVKVNNFRKLDIGFIEPAVYFGNVFKSTFGKEHLLVAIKEIYDSFPNDRFVAIFETFNPIIILKSPELIKNVTVKNFDHFHDLPIQIDEDIDKVFGRVLLSLKGQKWRNMRSTLTPAFTSSKMKTMVNFMNDCAERSVKYYEDQCRSNNLKLDMRDLTTRFTSDVIASTAFGLEVDSVNERENEFYTHAKNISDFTLTLVLKFLGFRLFPNWMKALGIPLVPASSTSYMRGLIMKAMNDREKSGIQRHDMLNLLIEAKNGTLKHEKTTEEHEYFPIHNQPDDKPSEKKWTDDDLLAQAIVFILGGYTSSATIMSFLLYELALNPNIQDKLRDEIDLVLQDNSGKLTYKALLDMKYLDMVVSEGLRKWPPIPLMNRLCVKDYDLGAPREGSNKNYQVKKGDSVWLPAYAVHFDADLWPDPEKFDPERFSDENKNNIKPYSYFPFGLGPRNCIGSRFALMSVKVMIFYFLSKFKFDVCARTTIPMKINPRSLLLDAKDGYWLEIKLRK